MSDPAPPPSGSGDSGTSSGSTSNGTLVTGVAITGIVISTFATALRLYTRRYLVKQLWIDDYMSILSWVGPLLACRMLIMLR